MSSDVISAPARKQSRCLSWEGSSFHRAEKKKNILAFFSGENWQARRIGEYKQNAVSISSILKEPSKRSFRTLLSSGLSIPISLWRLRFALAIRSLVLPDKFLRSA